VKQTSLGKLATRTGRLVGAIILAAASAAAVPRLTTVQDVLYKADGTKFNGLLIISWNSFEANDLSNIVSQDLTVKVVDGNFRVQLVPTADSNPPTYYSVKYNGDGKIQFQETWVVGTASTPLRIRDVRASTSSSSPLAPPQPDPDSGKRRRGIGGRSRSAAGERAGFQRRARGGHQRLGRH
jgi:hypothetical protein